MLADRFNIMMDLKSPTPVGISAQSAVNCVAFGEAALVLEYAHTDGLVHASCNQDIETWGNHTVPCNATNICKMCTYPVCQLGHTCQDQCWSPPQAPILYYARHYYSVIGYKRMKMEIVGNGPITCEISFTAGFRDYVGGIYDEQDPDPNEKEWVSIYGWDTDEDGKEYWMGRNSWGTFWGEDGYFRIETAEGHDLDLSKRCMAATPSFNKPLNEEQDTSFLQ